MKKILALFTAVVFAMTLGVAFAEDKAGGETHKAEKAEKAEKDEKKEKKHKKSKKEKKEKKETEKAQKKEDAPAAK
jgi:hypothetical protein